MAAWAAETCRHALIKVVVTYYCGLFLCIDYNIYMYIYIYFLHLRFSEPNLAISHTVLFLSCSLFARSFTLRDLPFKYLRINKDIFLVLLLTLNIFFLIGVTLSIWSYTSFLSVFYRQNRFRSKLSSNHCCDRIPSTDLPLFLSSYET